MTKYLLKRIVLGLLSVVVVVAIVMILIFMFTDREKIFNGDGIYTKMTNNEREIYKYSQWEKYGYLDYVQYTDYLMELTKTGEIDEATRAEAAKTLADVRKAMKIDYFDDAELIAEHTKKYQK